VHRLANKLTELGHKLVCFSFSPAPADALYEVRKIETTRHIRVMKKFEPAMAFKAQNTSGFDIVHYHGDDYLCKGSPSRVRTFYGSAFNEAKHAKTVGRFMYQSLFYCFEWISCLKGGRKTGISKATCSALPIVKEWVHCGVDTRVYRPGNEKTEFPSILFIGDLDSRKRGRMLVEIFNTRVLPVLPACVLSVVGPQQVFGPGIRYLGVLGETALVKEYRQSWLYCLPSSYEGFGVPAIEAMACSTAVAASRNPGTVEIIENNRTGLLAKDKDELADCILRILNDGELRIRLEENGLKEAREKYELSVTAHRYEKIYSEILSGRKA
jgi:glycosyltransferase involved in cell wall biosynthesis